MTDTTDLLDDAQADTPAGGPADTGSPAAPAAAPRTRRRATSGGLASMVLPELQEMAGKLGITGAGRLRKSQLIEAIQARQGGAAAASGGSASASPAGSAASAAGSPAEAPAATAPAATAPASDPPATDAPATIAPATDAPSAPRVATARRSGTRAARTTAGEGDARNGTAVSVVPPPAATAAAAPAAGASEAGAAAGGAAAGGAAAGGAAAGGAAAGGAAAGSGAEASDEGDRPERIDRGRERFLEREARRQERLAGGGADGETPSDDGDAAASRDRGPRGRDRGEGPARDGSVREVRDGRDGREPRDASYRDQGRDGQGRDVRDRDQQGRDGRDAQGRDVQGRDAHGRDAQGRDAQGRDVQGRDMQGRDGRDVQGRDGRDVQGRDSRDVQGRDSRDSRDVQGREHRDVQGRDAQGRDPRDRDPRDRDLQPRDGRDGAPRDGQPRDGQPRDFGPRDDDESGTRRGRFRERGRGRNRGTRGDRFGNEPEPLLSDDDVLIPVGGILDVLDNYGFIRTSGYLTGPNDVYVTMQQIRRHGLRRGDAVTGAVRQQREGERKDKFNALVRLDSVNGVDPEEATKRPDFTKLTPLYPQDRLRLETDPSALTTRVIDLVMPVGKGQRALIVSPPKAGKTMVMQAIANAITTNNPECHLMVVLVDERPEEVTDMQRSVKGEVIASTFDRPPQDHITVAELSIERAKRLVELGHDVVVLLDSITRLGRAYNLGAPASGRILTGGVDSAALYPPKRFLGAARNIENGGSLTIFATALVETGSAMDTVIFEEFKGTGNAELKLDRRLADKRIFPGIDVDASGTRKEEILLAPEELRIVLQLRRVLHALDTSASLELLLDKMKATRTNVEFLMQIQKTTVSDDAR